MERSYYTEFVCTRQIIANFSANNQLTSAKNQLT